jgi:hypothetical protein
MVSLAIVSLLVGAVLGWWFTIPVLLLAIFLALVVVAGVGAAAASLFVVTMGLQLGYVAGSALETYAAVRGRRRALRESRQAADASFEPATALIMQFSRIQLSRRRYPLSGDGRDQRDKIN